MNRLRRLAADLAFAALVAFCLVGIAFGLTRAPGIGSAADAD
jgi:hypothetical protein